MICRGASGMGGSRSELFVILPFSGQLKSKYPPEVSYIHSELMMVVPLLLPNIWFPSEADLPTESTPGICIKHLPTHQSKLVSFLHRRIREGGKA